VEHPVSSCNLQSKSERGAGIGTGPALLNGNSLVKKLTITRANITAVSISWSGIGGGPGDGNRTRSGLDEVRIDEAVIEAASTAAGIGSGC
jgi:hypothetical protein